MDHPHADTAEKRKEMKKAKKERHLRKIQERKNRDRQRSTPTNKLGKYLGKFLEVFEDEIENFYAIFKTIDEGGGVCVDDIEDKRVGMLLGKILKHLGLSKNQDDEYELR